MNTEETKFPISLARLLLSVDHIKKNQIPRYQMDLKVRSYVIAKRGAVPTQLLEEDLFVPTFQIATNPTWRYSDESEKIEECITNAFSSIYRQENLEALNIIECAVSGSEHYLLTDSVSLDVIVEAMSLLEEHDMEVQAIVCSPLVFRKLSLFEHKQLFIYRRKELGRLREIQKEQKTMYGYLEKGTFFDVPIYVSELVSTNTMYLLCDPEKVGVVAIKQDVHEIEAEEPKKLRHGRVITEDVGICVYNERAIAAIHFDLKRYSRYDVPKDAYTEHMASREEAAIAMTIEEIKAMSLPDEDKIIEEVQKRRKSKKLPNTP